MITSARLILRPVEPRDRAALHAMWGDARVMADLGPVKTAAESDAAIARHEGYRPTHGLGFWVLEDRLTGAAVGHAGLKPGAPDTPIAGMLEIGWILSPDYWGQGYASEAARASLDWAWANRSEDAVVAITSRDNTASRRLMDRLGMRHVPDLDFDHPLFSMNDPRRHTVVYRLDRPGATA